MSTTIGNLTETPTGGSLKPSDLFEIEVPDTGGSGAASSRSATLEAFLESLGIMIVDSIASAPSPTDWSQMAFARDDSPPSDGSLAGPLYISAPSISESSFPPSNFTWKSVR